MKLSLPALRNTPWFKATSGQWRYALRNTIAMCLKRGELFDTDLHFI